jgi:Cu-Zn family superoxide dismutase
MKTKIALAAFAAAVLLAACQTTPDEPLRASAQLKPTKGNKTYGEVTFQQVGAAVQIQAVVQGLKPGAEYGFHIHEVGDCSSDGMSAKGHFNPYGEPHGKYDSANRHAGDLPSLNAPAKNNKRGRARLLVQVDTITLEPGPTNIIGRAVIVHAQPDDYRTQPTGNAGARLACGVIKAD